MWVRFCIVLVCGLALVFAPGSTLIASDAAGDTTAGLEYKSSIPERLPSGPENYADLGDDACLIAVLDELLETFEQRPDSRFRPEPGEPAVEEQWRFLAGAFFSCAHDSVALLSTKSTAFWTRAEWLAIQASYRVFLDAARESGDVEWINVAEERMRADGMPEEVGEPERSDQEIIFEETCGHPLFETCEFAQEE